MQPSIDWQTAGYLQAMQTGPRDELYAAVFSAYIAEAQSGQCADWLGYLDAEDAKALAKALCAGDLAGAQKALAIVIERGACDTAAKAAEREFGF